MIPIPFPHYLHDALLYVPRQCNRLRLMHPIPCSESNPKASRIQIISKRQHQRHIHPMLKSLHTKRLIPAFFSLPPNPPNPNLKQPNPPKQHPDREKEPKPNPPPHSRLLRHPHHPPHRAPHPRARALKLLIHLLGQGGRVPDLDANRLAQILQHAHLADEGAGRIVVLRLELVEGRGAVLAARVGGCGAEAGVGRGRGGEGGGGGVGAEGGGGRRGGICVGGAAVGGAWGLFVFGGGC